VALGRVDAVLFDSFGTLVAMDPPAQRLEAALARVGFEVDAQRAASAFGPEIAYYLEHHLEGRDAASLADLRDRCAAVLRAALAVPELRVEDAREALLDSINFGAFPDAAPALRDLRARGARIIVASNWDCSLPEVLREARLADLVDGVVTSAEVGAAKPHPLIFERALEMARCPPERAVYVGDSPGNDVAGAAAAGIRSVLLARGGARPDELPADADAGAAPHARIATLSELASVLWVP